MKDFSRRRFLKIGGGAALYGTMVLYGLPGCGIGNLISGNGNGDSNDAKTLIKIGYLPITDHLPMIALSRSKFEIGNIQPVKYSGWPELAEALKSGVIDAGFALTPIGLELRENGVPLKAVLLGHRNGSVITVKADGDINDINGLQDKKIAIPSRFSTHNILLQKILDDHKIAVNNLEIIEMAPPEMVQALAGGQIDAFIVAEPFGAQAELQGVGRALELSKDIWSDHACCVLNVNETLIEKDREAVQELVNNLVETGKFIGENPAEAAELSRDYIGQPSDVIEHVLTNPKGRVTYDRLAPVKEDFTATQKYLEDFGITANRVDIDSYLDDSFAVAAYS